MILTRFGGNRTFGKKRPGGVSSRSRRPPLASACIDHGTTRQRTQRDRHKTLTLCHKLHYFHVRKMALHFRKCGVKRAHTPNTSGFLSPKLVRYSTLPFSVRTLEGSRGNSCNALKICLVPFF